MRNRIIHPLVCSLIVGLAALWAASDASASLPRPPRAMPATPAVSVAGSPAAAELGAKHDREDPQAPKDKPKKSKKNDDKDGDPDDGNAGGGNDNKTLPNDGPIND